MAATVVNWSGLASTALGLLISISGAGAQIAGLPEAGTLEAKQPAARSDPVHETPLSLFVAPIRTIADLKETPLSQLARSPVRLRGGIVSVELGQSFVVQDVSGTLAVESGQNAVLKAGLLTDVEGWLSRNGTNWILQRAHFRRLGFAAPFLNPGRLPAGSKSESEQLRLLTALAEVRGLSQEQARRGYPVRVRGVVTYYELLENDLFVQDDSAGLWVDCAGQELDIERGQWVELEGFTGPGLAPIIVKPRFQILGAAPDPEAKSFSMGELLTGRQDSQWVEFRGIVQSATNNQSRLHLSIGTDQATLSAFVPGATNDSISSTLVDASVRVLGVCGSDFNQKHQLTGVHLFIPDLAHIQVETPGPADPFSAPIQSTASVLQFRAERLGQHRVHIAGEVTWQRVGQGLYLQDQTGGVFVKTTQRERLQPGDRVEVVGFPRMGSYTPELQNASVRKIGTGAAPAPTDVTATQALNASLQGDIFDARLIRLKARLLDFIKTPTEQILWLQIDDETFTAHWAPEIQSPALPKLREGSLLAVTGVCEIQVDENGAPRSFLVRLRAPGDVVVLRNPAWWSLRHSLMMISLMGLGILAALAWVKMLQRQVRVQTQSLAHAQEELVQASHLAGMAEVATSVLHNVGNALNSINVSAVLLTDGLKQSKVVSVARTAALLQDHAHDLAGFLNADPIGRRLPAYLKQLGDHLRDEQTAWLEEAKVVREGVEHVNQIVAMQQQYSQLSGLTEMVNVPELAEQALRLHAGGLERHRVKVTREFTPGLPQVVTEKHKVLQILVNLVQNAKHACDESGRHDKRLTVRVSNGDDRVRIAVVDNGVGIPQENLARIFQHGFTTRKKGHGFGLHDGALAARELGGALLVHSAGPDRGATFTLELPLRPVERAQPQ